jgi:hypothetical protein
MLREQLDIATRVPLSSWKGLAKQELSSNWIAWHKSLNPISKTLWKLLLPKPTFSGLQLSLYLWKTGTLRMAIRAILTAAPNGVPSMGLY